MSINRVILLGHVGRDPEIRMMQSGDRVATFSIATSERWKDKNTGEPKEATEWHNIVVFNTNIVSIVEKFVHRGDKVSIQGMLKTRKWQDGQGNDRWSTEVVIGRFDGALGLEGSPQARQSEQSYGDVKSRGPRESKPAPSIGPSPPTGFDDDIPF